jgi:uncharacterized protein YjbI with pentapeptide repeats
MEKDYSNKNLQRASFKNEDLSYANFTNSDLRGADFSGANLVSANFTGTKTGITPLNTVLLFMGALIVSLLSGYFAMLSGHTVQGMLASDDSKIRTAGIATTIIVILFIVYAWWKGTGKAIMQLLSPVVLLAAIIGIISYISGLGTGLGMLYQIAALLFVVVMFIVGTIARVAAGTLSNVLFFIVALTGGIFGKSIGGGIASTIMAISCAMISKRALSGAKGFDSLRKLALFITARFGTNFRNSILANASFSGSKVFNSDFTNADLSSVNWNNSKKANCLVNGKVVTEKNITKTESTMYTDSR